MPNKSDGFAQKPGPRVKPYPLTNEEWAVLVAARMGSVTVIIHGNAYKRWGSFRIGQRDVTNICRKLIRRNHMRVDGLTLKFPEELLC